MIDTPQYAVDFKRVRHHYDRLSFLYRMFWGEHLHHGYFTDAENPKTAQIQLMEQLALRAAMPRGATVLDIGCGLGGSAIWLADRFACHVTGMTINPVQASIGGAHSAYSRPRRYGSIRGEGHESMATRAGELRRRPGDGKQRTLSG